MLYPVSGHGFSRLFPVDLVLWIILVLINFLIDFWRSQLRSFREEFSSALCLLKKNPPAALQPQLERPLETPEPDLERLSPPPLIPMSPLPQSPPPVPELASKWALCPDPSERIDPDTIEPAFLWRGEWPQGFEMPRGQKPPATELKFVSFQIF